MESAEARSLAHCLALKDIQGQTIAGVEAASTWMSFTVGEHICTKGDENTDFIFLVDGSARVLTQTTLGQEIAFADVEAGGHFGELSLLDGGPRSATVVAVADSVVATVPAP
ncbi:MAG: cyclic nucleotide-binding domain-containing protein [Rhodospirillaceae bacterium]|jgi:CRP/FNR family transcriptional regulator, cyclic AMP receptor protein|nr:cyclic nucleotide-binding domain-containing protein [Rhodospirillaceae bacterium]MBT6203101.1 cyclic nucleotide-binding domain-containing protein [Rhodospirillaceae bacterium]MBT6510481.1 cyclic nucleotide-binding domain-containing protein [Rhodospirillaceae bacterium]MBT7613968.1 cyclic nucleotide-binding domain-containing protein [Rhodospirillaceae bacterium]MBT7648180.1 cyclic nucleotide-binding domain-containing protein [Rhodospirillaceae bacterium]